MEVARVDTVHMRRAGRELLSLGLMDARNRSLRWAAAFESSAAGTASLARDLGRLGWFQEYWIARNVERQRGEACDVSRPKLASILPQADAIFEHQGDSPTPDLATIRQYLFDTLETSLELLEVAAEDDAALYFYRLALQHEDEAIERFAERAQALGLDTGLLPQNPTRPIRPPLLLPATRFTVGSPRGGFVPDRERWAHEVDIPEFEIDSHQVTWAQFSEFVEDGGYDERTHWSDEGWAWVQAEGRRTPRHVDQMRQGVLQRRFGRLLRVPPNQSAMHLSWFEANAWCRWAGRRLPSEAEWEMASLEGPSRGFSWGEVREWTAGTLRPYPLAGAPSPGQGSTEGQGCRVLRGASFATPGRLRSERARHAARPEDDSSFCGFRSCAI